MSFNLFVSAKLKHDGLTNFTDKPSEIFQCEWPGCPRTFVRQDLRKRHYKRHEGGVSEKSSPSSIVTTPIKLETKEEFSIPLKPSEEPKLEEDLHSSLLLGLSEPNPIEAPLLPATTTAPLLDNTTIDPTAVGPVLSQDQEYTDTANEIISWLFSDAMLANVRDPLLSPTFSALDSPMSLQNLVTPPAFSEELFIKDLKRQQMLDYMPGLRAQFAAHNIYEDAPFQQRYLTAYWTTFHPQFPILHKPTFNPDKYPCALLWCILLEGAALLKDDLIARLIADPLRSAIFGSPDFNAPAKLWVIQALLILEVYEKSQSDRQLHIRAHIHHGTTLQLLRRGTILQGGNAGTGGKSDAEDYLAADTDPWKRWILTEATKRAALMAFVVDVYHSAIFGHSNMIAIHEIRLSLPCSQYLWDSFPANGQQILPKLTTLPLIEALKVTLNNKHVNTSPFGRKVLLSGLLSIAKQLEQRDLQLDSIGWRSSTESGNNNGNNPSVPTHWKDLISASLDFWLNDFKNTLQHSNSAAFDQYPPPPPQAIAPFLLLNSPPAGMPSDSSPIQDGGQSLDATAPYVAPTGPVFNNFVIPGCPDPFYHMLHIFLHVSHLDVHILAGAPEIYSNHFRATDYERSYRTLKQWAMSPLSLSSVKHAVLLLEETYCPSSTTHKCPNPYSSRPVVAGDYRAADDNVIHRPRAIVCAMVVLWCYGFASHGPESQDLLFENSETAEPYTATTAAGAAAVGAAKPSAAEIAEAAYERAKRSIPKKSALEYISSLGANLASLTPRNRMQILEGSNELAGLLRLVIDSLEGYRWQLAVEDRRLLIHCLERTLGKPTAKCIYHLDKVHN